MDRVRVLPIMVAAIAVAAADCTLLAIATLNSFASPSGDLAVSSAPAASTALLALGLLALIALELARSTVRRSRQRTSATHSSPSAVD
jgi:hypothetical protein